jgi:hypothetical protein
MRDFASIPLLLLAQVCPGKYPASKRKKRNPVAVTPEGTLRPITGLPLNSKKFGDMVMSDAKTTTDHAKIRRWAEERGGHPATVEATSTDSKAGILRLDFDPKDEGLREISWDDFFRKFDREKLAFLYQDQTTEGKVSRFHKFVDRNSQ